MQRSTSSVTQGVQGISIAELSDEVSPSVQPEKRDLSVTGKENTGQSPVRKKKTGGNRVPLQPLN
jgi:hypothetical protein